MKAERRCKLQPINWSLLPELEAKLARLGYKARPQHASASITLNRFPDSLTFDATEPACENIREAGEPLNYGVWLHREKGGEAAYIYFGLIGRAEINVFVDGEHVDVKLLEAVVTFLGLQPAEPDPPEPSPLRRTAFIAHRFDDAGGALAGKLARFLELLGFTVVSGRAFAPKSVAEKVRERMSEQAVVFAILTDGTDDTWLTQEQILARAKDKPLIVLKATDVESKAGLLADLEYIPFDPPLIEGAFIPVLEGLREIGYFGKRR